MTGGLRSSHFRAVRRMHFLDIIFIISPLRLLCSRRLKPPYLERSAPSLFILLDAHHRTSPLLP